MTITHRRDIFRFGIKSEKGERYQDEHSMHYEHDTIIIIAVTLNHRNNKLNKFWKKISMEFD